MDVLHLSLRQLQIFAAIAKTGSTAAAAGEIALSQSAISSALKALEHLLGQALFERAGRKLVLNETGCALLPEALALLDSAQMLERNARQGLAAGHSLRIGASTTLGNYVLPDILSRFHTRLPENPAWQARVTIRNSADIAAAVRAFELDVGLIEGPCHEADIEVSPWACDELIVVAAPSEAQRIAAAANSREALARAVWLLREHGSGTREVTDQHLLPCLGGYRRSIELGSSEAIKRAAANGLGLACLSRWVVEDLLAQRKLEQITAGLPAIRRQCYLLLHRDRAPGPALQAFLGCARETVAGPSAQG
ncbi:LysR family transcriptional regulator [Niveibacterium terrae]|uniref:LysR family transcriptional regulator n=1 Tax=Niveibacterium terrae TaxID=3373598 RepID=UPI003A921199